MVHGRENEAHWFAGEVRGALSTISGPPSPGDARSRLLGRIADESQRLCGAAMRGEFACVHCSSPGPHSDTSSTHVVTFSCKGCGKSLGITEMKLWLFATLTPIAAEGPAAEKEN
jgi:hypothetical protein